jgi:hypothetical protein
MPAAKRKAPAKPKPAKPAQPWERLDGEPDRAFEAFRLYLEQGPARSTGKVGESLGHRSSKQSERWSSRWQWRRRVAAFDQAAAATSDTAHLDAVAKRSKRQAELAQLQGEALALPTVELLRRARQDPSVLQKLGLEDLVRLSGCPTSSSTPSSWVWTRAWWCRSGGAAGARPWTARERRRPPRRARAALAPPVGAARPL